MNLENVKYDAFISYRHCELDKFVAENLHKQLEAFKIPKSLINAGKTNGKTKIERVFRDQEELPLTSNLADPITKALQGSDYLIVICSPRLFESKWCLKEIDTFISMHGRERILAVLIEGEPDDSFPEILRFYEQETIDEYGNTRIERVEIEPLAADVRGKNKTEILKQIKSEMMRLIAPMLNCNYDDLKMRHKEARQKKILRISFAISLVCLIFTAISTTMALTIHKQANTIEAQYQAALENQAISYASISQTLLKQEDRMAATAVARMVLPDSLDNQKDKAYTAAAEFALSDSLGIYNNGENNFPVKSLEQTTPICFMMVSPDETTITTVNTNNIVTIFDVAQASTIASFKCSSDVYNESEITYLGSDKLTYTSDKGFFIYDIPTKTESFYELDSMALYINTSSDGAYIGICTVNNFIICDQNGKCLYSKPIPSTHTGDNIFTFNPEQSLCAFACHASDTGNGILYLVNYATGKEIYSVEFDISSFNKCIFYGNQLIVSVQKDTSSSYDYANYSSNTHVFSFPFDNNTPNWEFVQNNSSFDELTGTLQWENQTIVLSGYNEIAFINGKNGTLIHSTALNSEIVDIALLSTEGSLLASTEQGEKILVMYDPNYRDIVMEEFDTSNGEFSDFYYSNEFVAAYHKNSTTINIYQKTTSDKAENIATFDDYINNSFYSAKQNTFLVTTYDNHYFLKHDDTENIFTIAHDNYTNDIFFAGDNDEQIVFVNEDSLTYYNTVNGERLKEVSISDEFIQFGSLPSTYIDCTKDHKTIVYTSSDNKFICLYSIKENIATTVPAPRILPSSAERIGINETGDKYAIACTEDNTLSVFDKDSHLIVETEINAALVNNIIISDTANCVIVSFFDKTVTLFQLSDLSPLKTFTNIQNNIERLDIISFYSNDSNAPAYALYDKSECYLLDKDLEQIARIYHYVGCNEESELFYLYNGNQIFSVPYYNYDMLIKEADKLLENYELSNYRKNQLGI